jgi:large subunit ribosomal protein L10
LNRTDKSAVIDRLRTELADVPAIVLTDFKGLDVETVNDLRSRMRKNEIRYEVVKNTLIRAAVAGTTKENIGDLCKGNTAIAYHLEDPAASAKVLAEFAKENDGLVLKGAWLDGNLLDDKGVVALSKLPGKDELRAKLLSLLLAAPTGFVRLLNAAPTTFVQVLQAREQQLAE